MTPKLRWRSAYACRPMIADGGTMDACMLGKVEVGRVQRIGKRGSWLCHLPQANGYSFVIWHDAKTWQAARAALEAEIASFMDAIGMARHRRITPPSRRAQPDLFLGKLQ